MNIEINYLAEGGALDDAALTAVRDGMFSHLRDVVGVSTSNFSIVTHPDGLVVVEATLSGVGVRDLTDPLDALNKTDASLTRSLLRTGLFEEFDVARRRLHVEPDI